MKCTECSGIEYDFDENLGETICKTCGFVKVSHIFEETTRVTQTNEHHLFHRTGDSIGGLGSFVSETNFESNNAKLTGILKRTQRRFRNKKDISINRGLMECNMVLSPYLPNNSLKETVHSYYRGLYLSHKFVGIPLSLRACGIVVISLREYGLPISISEVATNNGEDPHKVSKYSRHFARFLGKSHQLQNMPISPWIDRVCNDLGASRDFTRDCRLVVEYLHQLVLDHDIHFSRSYMATGIWVTSILRKEGKPEFTQQEICTVCNCSAVAQRLVSKKIFLMLNIQKNKLSTLTVEEFIAGIRRGGK